MLNKNNNDITQDQIIKRELSRANHKPGYSITHHDGTIYHVGPTGAWQRHTSRRCSNSTNLKNNGVRRRLNSARTRV